MSDKQYKIGDEITFKGTIVEITETSGKFLIEVKCDGWSKDSNGWQTGCSIQQHTIEVIK